MIEVLEESVAEQNAAIARSIGYVVMADVLAKNGKTTVAELNQRLRPTLNKREVCAGISQNLLKNNYIRISKSQDDRVITITNDGYQYISNNRDGLDTALEGFRVLTLRPRVFGYNPMAEIQLRATSR